MSKAEKKADARGLALYHIANYLEQRLKFPKADFIEWLSMEDGGKSDRTLQRYIKGDSPMKKWTFEQFWAMVESTVKEYLEYEDFGRPLVPHAEEIWKQEKGQQEEQCRLYFMDLDAPERAADFPEPGQRLIERADEGKRRVLDAIEGVFKALNPNIQYSLQRNFLALTTVTAEDCLFLAHILTRTETEKEALKTAMLQEAAVDAKTMLAYLKSEEVLCWVNLMNRDYSDTARNSTKIWDRFSDKFMALTVTQFSAVSQFIEIILLFAIDKKDLKAEKIEVELMTAEDIELLFLFKYFLTPEKRRPFLENR